MTERIDHAAAARNLLEMDSGIDDDMVAPVIAIAQVHATLALVEQQRIANLIALSASGIGPLMQAGDRALMHPEPHPDWPNTNIDVVRPEIRQALGLND